MARKPTAPEIRFWVKVNKSAGEDECWPWLAHIAWNGYGEFRISTKELVKSHRFAYENMIGEIPSGLDLDHRCRNRACCNPRHLEPVTRKVNAQRGLCGAHLSKLTSQQYAEIKALRGVVPGADLGRRYGVSKSSISRIQLHHSLEEPIMSDRFQRLAMRQVRE